MRPLLERFRSGRGLSPRGTVPSGISASHSDAEAEYLISRLKAALTLFVWLATLLLAGLGSLSHSPAPIIGKLTALGSIVLSLGVAALILAPRKRILTVAVPFCCFLFLITSLQFAGHPSSQRSVLLDLELVILIIVPAIFGLWSWKMQSVAGLAAVGTLLVRGILPDGALAVQTVVLICTAGLLATLVLRLQGAQPDSQTSRWQILASRLLHEASLRHLPQQLWSIMLLQSGLMVVLIFVDISLGRDELSSPVLAKLYGLIIVVFGSSLAVLLRPERVPRAIMLTCTLVGFILSLSRIGSLDSGVLQALPLVYLFLVTSPLHWGIEVQLQLVWSLLLGDLLIKSAAVRLASTSQTWFEIIGEMLAANRGEIAVMILGGTVSVLMASSIRRYRFSHLSQFVDLYQLSGTKEEDAEARMDEAARQTRLQGSIQIRALPERNRQLLFGLLCLGLFSCALSSRLLLLRSEPSGGLLVLTWMIFLLLWGVLFYQDRRASSWAHLWGFGAALKVLLLLWPTALLLTTEGSGHLWIFWPAALCLGIGFIPWNLQELVPIVLIEMALGVELSFRLGFGPEANAILLGAGVVGVLICLQNSRRLRERQVFTHYQKSLSECSGDAEVSLVLADYIRYLFDAEAVFISRNPEHLEYLRGDISFLLKKGDWPIRELRDGIVDPSREKKDVDIRAINWLPGKLTFFDRRLGMIAPACGLLVDIGPADAEGVTLPRMLLFIVTTMPVYEATRDQELTVARMLAAMAGLKRREFAEQDERHRLSQAVEAQVIQREYELSTLVHDINNTVQDLTLLCEMILEDFPEEEAPPAPGAEPSVALRVKRIAAIARSVATVVSDAKRRRELEKLEDLTPRELVEVTEVIRELVSFAAIRAERKRITVEQPALPAENIFVLISVKEHLETILRNILNNAILYSPPGAKIWLRLWADEATVYIEVKDTGPGLTPDEFQTVFEPGYRGKAATTIQGGLGLGLSESLRVARAAGGDIVAHSSGPGEGSTFTVTLPRQVRSVHPSVSQHWALLVDDQPALTDFYARIARAMQLQPEVAASVDEAWTIVESRGRPGLVMTDIHLGSSDGLELVKRLRSEFGNQLPIVVISGLTSEEIMQRVRAVGATDFVAKPVGKRALFARIQSLIASEGV